MDFLALGGLFLMSLLGAAAMAYYFFVARVRYGVVSDYNYTEDGGNVKIEVVTGKHGRYYGAMPIGEFRDITIGCRIKFIPEWKPVVIEEGSGQALWGTNSEGTMYYFGFKSWEVLDNATSAA